MRGVPLNTYGMSPVQVMKNQVFSDMVNILGLKWGEYNDGSRFENYEKTYYMADNRTDMIFFGVALYALLSGLILIVMRKRIFAHLVGFLVIENGVFLFSMAIGVELPILINLAIMLDILISILILGMFLRRMDDDIHTDETDALTSIKD